MIGPRDQEQGERTTYACMLWNVKSGRPTVVTIHVEHPDRWIGRRCVIAATCVDAPLETFLKSEWRRGEPAERAASASAPDPYIPTPAGFQGFVRP